MDNIAPNTDKKQEAYLVSKETSDELTEKAKYFAYEQRADGNVTGIGRTRKHSAKPAKSILASISAMVKALVVNMIVDDINQATLAQAKAFASTAKKLLAGVATPLFVAEETLTQAFTSSVGVSETVYAALEAEVADFDIVKERINQANSSDFIGPMPTAELEAFKHGVMVCGPLTCEFHAHASLAEKGIEYDRESNAYIYPEEMVNELTQKFGSVAEKDAPERVLVSFKNAVKEQTMSVHKFDLSMPNQDSLKQAPDLAPAPVYIPK